MGIEVNVQPLHGVQLVRPARGHDRDAGTWGSVKEPMG